jgi:hypothetical protein
MKAILVMALAAGAALLTGCETTAVVERPVYGGSRVYYSSGRPYYYTGGVRYWGYPVGYSGYRGYGYRGYGYRDYDHDHRYNYSRNVEVERNTYVVNNNRTVYRSGNRDRDVRYRSGDVSRQTNVKTTTNVKTKNNPQVKVKKKKYNNT